MERAGVRGWRAQGGIVVGRSGGRTEVRRGLEAPGPQGQGQASFSPF